jgi:hypothetical protein
MEKTIRAERSIGSCIQKRFVPEMVHLLLKNTWERQTAELFTVILASSYINYSYLSASIGSSREAFERDNIQRRSRLLHKPQMTKRSKIPKPVLARIKIQLSVLMQANPVILPRIPPVMLMTIASIKNCISMSMPLAPSDIRKPISFVLSVTDTYMIFMMPMPPTNNEIPAIAASKTVNNWLVELNVFINSGLGADSKSHLVPRS